MNLNSGMTSNLTDLELNNVMEVVSAENESHDICASDILQQALEEASQTLGPSVEDCENIKISNGKICIDTSNINANEKIGDLSESDPHQEISVTFNENGSCNLISIPDTMNLENFTVPVFTAESNDVVALALGNLPITTMTDTITLSISNNTVTFPCTLEADSNGILTSTGILNGNNDISHKDILSSENAADLLDSISSQDSLSGQSKTSNMFPSDIVELQNTVDEHADSLNSTADDSLSGLELPPPKDTGAPIGSSENPIQIVQHGTTYHSTQMLNQEQLAQIAQVLQQQQVAKSTEKGRSAVLYNPSTNTRIVYRVVYPSGINAKIGESKNSPEGSTTRTNQQSNRGGRGRSRKAWTKRPYEDERKVEGPDLSREEKEQKKKHRPRTRSGRISKPPSYMIKDYKRIHHLDFNEEPQNDSDGGYSDFHLSEEELQQGDERDPTNALPPGVSTIKPRNYKCSTCDKAYIGRGGLGRHYRLNPGHGMLTPEEGDDLMDPCLSDENSNASLVSESSRPLSADATPEVLLTEMPPVVAQPQEEVEEVSEIRVLPVKSTPAPKSKENQVAPLSKRKAKLKELIQPFGDADLLEAVMPRLTQAITLWEFLLLKSEKGDPSLPHVPDIFRHFEDLLSRLQRLAQDCLVLTSSSASVVTNVALSSGSASPPLTSLMADENKVYVEITNERVGQVLGVSTGLYEVVQWKLLEHVPSLLSGTPSQNASGIGKRPGPRQGFPGTPSRKRPKKSNDLFAKNIVHEPVMPDDRSNMATFRVDENSSLESIPNISGNRASLDKSTSLLHSGQLMEPFSALTSQSQDSNFSCSLDSSCQVSSAEDLLPIANHVSLSRNLVFSLAGGTTPFIELPTQGNSKMNLDLSVLPKVNDLSKGHSLLSFLPSDDKSVDSNAKRIQNIPNLRVHKVDIFPKGGNFLSIAGNDLNRTAIDEKNSSHLDLSNSGYTFLKDGDTLLTQNRAVQSDTDISTSLANSVEVSSSFLSLLNDTPIMMDVPISLASLKTTPLTVMSSGSSLSSVPPLDALLSQFRMSEESSVLRDALTQAVDQTKEMECPSNMLQSSSNDDIPVIQLVVPEVSSGILNSPSATTNHYETMDGHEHVTTSLLSNNVIIVQNEDGTTTLQLPTDQPFSLETIQAILAMDQNFAAEILKDGLNCTDNK